MIALSRFLLAVESALDAHARPHPALVMKRAVLPKPFTAIVRLALETGLQRADVTDLEWSQLDFESQTVCTDPDQAKARKAVAVPLSAEAAVVIREPFEKCKTHVFRIGCKRVCPVDTKAWRNALTKVGISDFCWGNLCRTWASGHVHAGTPILKEPRGP